MTYNQIGPRVSKPPSKWTIVGEIFGVCYVVALVVGFGYCVSTLPQNCREVTPRHWRCE